VLGHAGAAAGFAPWTGEELRRALAADLLRADVSGRAKALRGTEARDLADALLAALRSRAASPLDETAVDGAVGAAAADEVARLACAAWLGLAGGTGAAGQPWAAAAQAAGAAVKKIHVRRFRERADGYESPVDEEDDVVMASAGGGDDEGGTAVSAGGGVRQVFDIEWELALGAVAGRFQTKGLVVGAPATTGGALQSRDEQDDEAEEEGAGERLRRRCERLEERLRLRECELKDLRDQVLKVALRT
jgi:hypothetical protein